ncbi:MAG: phospholipase domain-containing protein [Actinomadura sp.]
MSSRTGKRLTGSWATTGAEDAHDFSVFGPNGYLRGFRGRATGLEVTARPDGADLRLVLTNSGRSTARFTVTDAYGGRETGHTVRPGGRAVHTAKPRGSHSWYDLSVTADADTTFLRRFAGHVETGGAGVSDPAISPS